MMTKPPARHRRAWRWFIRALALLIGCLLPPIGGASEAAGENLVAAPRRLNLTEAKRLAFESNWDLLAARSDVDVATAQKIVAREFPNPTFSAGASRINTDGRPNSTAAGNDLWHRSYDTVVAINQLFEIGGKRAGRQAAAAAEFQAAQARLNDARRILDLGVTRNYITVLLTEANVRILKQSAELLRRQARIAETRLQAGDISLADQSQIAIAADRLELDSRAAETAAASARITVEVLMGVPAPRGDWAPGETLDGLANLPFLASQAEPGANRPDLAAAEWLREKADAEVQRQKAQRVPDPTVLVQFEHEPPDQPNTIGVGVSFPLPLWNRNRGGIQSARAAQQQAALQVEKVKAQIASEIATARLVYDDVFARWQRYLTQIQPRSEEIRKTVSFAYEKGGASLLDLLTAQRNDNDVRLATAQAAAEAAEAMANLKAALNLNE